MDAQFDLKTKVLAVKAVDSKTAHDYREIVNQVLDEHGIKEKTFSFSTDNEPSMLKAFCCDIRNGCICHIQSKACQKATGSTKLLRKTRKKFRAIARKANKSPKFSRAIVKTQKSSGVKVRTLKQEVKTRFTATHTMFRSFANDPDDNSGEDINISKVKENIKCINDAMVASLNKKDVEKLKIAEQDVNVLVNLLPLLDYMEEGINLLGGQKYCSGSVALPFLCKFLQALESNEDDPIYLAKFKEVLSTELVTRCKKNLNFMLLAKSSLCDKRFSKLTFLDYLNKAKVTELKKSNVLDAAREEISDMVAVDDIVAQSEPPPTKKKRFLDDFEDDPPVKVSALEQFEIFLKESPIQSSECPFKWFKMRLGVYPDFSKFAAKYLSVQVGLNGFIISKPVIGQF